MLGRTDYDDLGADVRPLHPEAYGTGQAVHQLSPFSGPGGRQDVDIDSMARSSIPPRSTAGDMVSMEEEYKRVMPAALAAETLIKLYNTGMVRKDSASTFRKYKVRIRQPGCCSTCNDCYSGACNTGARCGGCNSCGCCTQTRLLYRKDPDDDMEERDFPQMGKRARRGCGCC